MAPSPDDLSIVTLGRDILAGVVEGYGAHGIELPSRQYLTLGTPVNDCEQLVVSWQQAYLGTPGDEASLPQQCDAVKTAVFTVQLCRSMPVVSESGKSPSAEAIQSASEVALLDAYVLFDLVAHIDPFGLGVIVTTDVVEVSGGLSCIQVQTTLAIP
jgi:hypothetical protein